MAQTELTSNLLRASSSWQGFSLDTRRPHLDKAATNTKSQNAQSQVARKGLAESTKAFKKCLKGTEPIATTDEEKQLYSKLSTSSRSIVKAYQEEIDSLTKRCKASDALVLDLYRGLYELPDPAPLLTNAVEHLESMGGQVEHLLKGMEEMQHELENKNAEHKMNLQAKDDELNKWKKQCNEATAKCTKLEKELKKEKESVSQRNHAQAASYMSKEEKEELIELRREVAEYEVEFKTLKNQDITIKKLNARIEDLVANQEDELQAELKKAQEHLAQTEGRRAAEALEREAAMARKLASLELELKAERAGSEATQASLLEADEGANEREAAWEAQRQILVDDADRVREQMHEVKRERDALKIKLEAMNMEGAGDGVGGSGNGGKSGKLLDDASSDVSSMQTSDFAAERKAYEAEVQELTVAVTVMREEMKAKDEMIDNLQTSMQTTVESLTHERTYLANKVSELEADIASAPAKEMIDNMRRELRILKKLEYNAVDVDIDTEREAPEMTSSGADDVNELESVLINKLRKVEADLVKERREKSNYHSECEDLRGELKKVQDAKAEADALAMRLEADLEKAISSASPSSSAPAKENHLLLNAAESDPSTLEHILDPNAPLPVAKPIVPQPSSSATDKMNDDHSVATIVMAQRDRLRARCDALEAERDSFKRELQVQVSTSESLKVDNTKLYEKVRYLQSYANSSGMNARAKTSLADRDLDLEALEQRYEASVDPFRQFSRAERQRKMKEMSPMERTVFFVARTVLGSKEMRTVLFFYVLGMHLLVFVTTYHWSHGCHTVPNHADIDSMHAGLPEMAEGQ